MIEVNGMNINLSESNTNFYDIWGYKIIFLYLQLEDSTKMASEQRSLVRYAEESQGSRLARKSKEAPLFPIGMFL